MQLLLGAFLLLWEPANFASEALTVARTLSARGVWPLLELIAHAGVAALTAAAALALWNGSPDGRRLAAVAVLASAARTLQTLWWSALPHDVKPGDQFLIAAIAVTHAAAWVLYLGRAKALRHDRC